MDDILLNIIVLGCIIILGGGIFLYVQKKQKESRQILEQMAQEHGWRIQTIKEPLAWGIQIQSDDWTLEALSRSTGRESGPGSTDVSQSTTWSASSEGEIFLIGTRSSQADLGSFGERMQLLILQKAFGSGADDIHEVKLDNQEFNSRYMVWAKNSNEIVQSLTPGIQIALLAWADQNLVIKRKEGTLSIEMRGINMKKPDELQQLIQLGESLLKMNAH